MTPLRISRRSLLAIGISILAFGRMSITAHAEEAMQLTRVGRIELTGIMLYGSVGLGGATTGVSVEVGRRIIPVRVLDQKLLQSIERLAGKSVWVDGVLNFEEWFDEAAGKKKPVLVLHASHIRARRLEEAEAGNEVTIEGHLENGKVRFGKSLSVELAVVGANEKMVSELAKLQIGRQRLEGQIKHNDEANVWQCEVTRILPPRTAR